MEKISLIIPAHDEETRLKETLSSYVSYFSEVAAGSFEILVICNGCSDNTPQIAADFSMSHPQVQTLNIPEKIGKGGAVRKGFLIANGEIIAFVDADGAIAPGETWKLIDRVSRDADGAISSRGLPGAIILHEKPPAWRLASRGYNLLIRLFFGLPFRDTQCGAKAFRRQVIHSIINDIRISGMSFDVELLWKVKRKGYDIQEIPIIWQHQPKNGTTNHLLRTTFKMALDTLRLRFKS